MKRGWRYQLTSLRHAKDAQDFKSHFHAAGKDGSTSFLVGRANSRVNRHVPGRVQDFDDGYLQDKDCR